MSDFLDILKISATAVYRFVTHRILWLFIVAAAVFYLLAVRLFELQIVMHDSFLLAPPKTRTVTVPIPPLRGTIYDAKGRPLAINRLSNAVNIDPSIPMTNEGIQALVKIFERNGETYLDDFPLTKEEPYAFNYPENDTLMENGMTVREWYEYRWKDDMTVSFTDEDGNVVYTPETATAEQSFEHLRKQFDLDPALSNAEARKILNIRCMLYMKRMIVFDSYNPVPVTLATGVSDKTVAAIEENSDLFPGVYIEVQSLREYPQGKYFSHMLGYIREINEEELARNKDNGYSNTDLIGKAGLERSMEAYLRGTGGSQTFEVDALGRRLPGTETQVVEPEPGGKIFLTVDSYYNRKAYDLLEEHLTQTIVAKIKMRATRTQSPITIEDIYASFINSNNLPFGKVLDAKEGTPTFVLKQFILERFPEANASEDESIEQIKTIFADGIEKRLIYPADIMLSLIDLGIFTDPDGEFFARLTDNRNNARDVTIEKILAKELTPQMINLDPFSGSVVVTDVKNGDVLAAVGYPSYDNNRFVNVFDNEYNNMLYQDPTNPTVFRPFMEARAPGSTMKMVTAAAVLETGTLTSNTRIYDRHTYTAVGRPYVNCWSGSSHGNINVSQALQTSCNYFFCEAAYRLSNINTESTFDGIQVLNDYLEYFGFNEKTGVEIGEYYDYFDQFEDLEYKMSSPELKEFITLQYNPFADPSQSLWYAGDTVRTAMGQSFSNYTPAMMARYVSQIANRGTRYPLHLVQTVEDAAGGVLMEYEPKPDVTAITVSDSTWDTIIEGMRLVTEGTSGLRGTAVADFAGFPIRVAGKTGTAEQDTDRNDHSSFACFAPFENPEIAVYVNVPFGDTSAYTHVTARIAKEMITEVLGQNNIPEKEEPTNVIRK